MIGHFVVFIILFQQRLLIHLPSQSIFSTVTDFVDLEAYLNLTLQVVRYHSLVIDADSLPSELIPIAWTSSTNACGFHDIEDRDICGVSGSQNSLFVSQGTFTVNDESFHHSRNVDSQKQIIMGVKHTSRTHYGVQVLPFPERIFV